MFSVALALALGPDGDRVATAQPSPSATHAPCRMQGLPRADFADAAGTGGAAAATSSPAIAKISVAAPGAPMVFYVAATPEQREIGLMCVTRMKPHVGMIFVFAREAAQGFWMKNTLIPLDMVFVRADGRVSSVAANVPKSTVDTPDDAVARREGLGRFVIELNAGEAARDGIRAGTRLRFPSFDNASAPPAAAQRGAEPSAQTILRDARRAFRAIARPPFVVYTLVRSEQLNGVPDFGSSYTRRIWYRSADGGALIRRSNGKAAHGPLAYDRPRFNAPLDPGPPTADIFEQAPPQTPVAAPLPASTELRAIGSITVEVENEYTASIAGETVTTYHLTLAPRRDPERNRLREIWVERADFRVSRFRATDRLYYEGTGYTVPQLFDVHMGSVGIVPVVERIVMRNIGYDLLAPGTLTGDYRFDGIVFPAELPDWYFDASAYHAHAAEAPVN